MSGSAATDTRTNAPEVAPRDVMRSQDLLPGQLRHQAQPDQRGRSKLQDHVPCACPEAGASPSRRPAKIDATKFSTSVLQISQYP